MSKAIVIPSTVVALAAAAIFGSGIEKDDPKLSEYQSRCALAISYFIFQIPQRIPGHKVTYGEAHRPGWVALEYAKQGIGRPTSLHTKRLAVDLMLFKNGVYQTDSASYIPLANLWKQIGPHFGIVPAAGVDFNDGNHFSCAYGGIK